MRERERERERDTVEKEEVKKYFSRVMYYKQK